MTEVERKTYNYSNNKKGKKEQDNDNSHYSTGQWKRTDTHMAEEPLNEKTDKMVIWMYMRAELICVCVLVTFVTCFGQMLLEKLRRSHRNLIY